LDRREKQNEITDFNFYFYSNISKIRAGSPVNLKIKKAGLSPFDRAIIV